MNLHTITDSFTLLNGVKVPCLGYGTYKTESNEDGLQAIKDAIKNYIDRQYSFLILW